MVWRSSALAVCCALFCLQHTAGQYDMQLLVQRSVLPHERRLCTLPEEEDYLKEFKAYWQRVVEKEQSAFEQFQNISRDVVALHAAPLLNASERILAMALHTLRPALTQIMKFGMQQVMKPKKKYSNSFLVDVNETMRQFNSSAAHVQDMAKAMFFEGLDALDASFNTSMGADEIGPPRRESEIRNYLLWKVLPIILSESNPKLAKTVMLVRSKQSLTKVIFSLMDAFYLQAQSGFFHETVPTKDCEVCVERYWRQVDSVDSGCVAERCSGILMECGGSTTVSCIQRFAPCLDCHAELLAQVDQCSNQTSIAKTLAKFGPKIINLGKVLQGELHQHYDKFIDKLSEALVP